MPKYKTEIVVQEERTVGEWSDARTFEDTDEGNQAAHEYAEQRPNTRVIRREATAKAREATVTEEPEQPEPATPSVTDDEFNAAVDSVRRGTPYLIAGKTAKTEDEVREIAANAGYPVPPAREEGKADGNKD